MATAIEAVTPRSDLAAFPTRKPMLRPDSFALTALLAFLISFGPLSIDLFLPSMPEIGLALSAPASQMQLTISLYLVGYAIGQIVYGPVSDRYGRKPVLLLAYVTYCLSSAVCFFAPNIEMLIVGRILQALGVSGGLVVSRALVRDLHDGVQAGRQLSRVHMMMGFVPIVAPLIGGLLLTFHGWRTGFVFQGACGAIAGLLVWRYIDETHKPSPTSLRAMVDTYRTIMSNRVFVANLAVGAVGYSGLFAWISGSPFVLQSLEGLTPLQYSLYYAASCVGFMIGGAIASRVVVRLGLDRTAGVGAVVLTLAGVGMIAGAAIGAGSAVMLTFSMTLYLGGIGLLLSQIVAAALTPFPQNAGTASSLIGFTQQCSAAVMGTVVGNSLASTAWPMALGVAVAGGGSLVLWIATRKLRTA
ncbi:MAG TPA: multidrug effflux MFS transporter [Xanthobacteraceae bacterium]|nr:multidrug effflux MFS transporter [Xanthobacteraceae bacterium]